MASYMAIVYYLAFTLIYVSLCQDRSRSLASGQSSREIRYARPTIRCLDIDSEHIDGLGCGHVTSTQSDLLAEFLSFMALSSPFIYCSHAKSRQFRVLEGRGAAICRNESEGDMRRSAEIEGLKKRGTGL